MTNGDKRWEDNAPSDRLWRVEQRHNDALARLERAESRIEAAQLATQAFMWRIDAIEHKLGELERDREARRAPPAVTLLGDPTLVKAIVWFLIAALAALAGVKGIQLADLIK